jgi:hypothetical protein
LNPASFRWFNRSIWTLHHAPVKKGSGNKLTQVMAHTIPEPPPLRGRQYPSGVG